MCEIREDDPDWLKENWLIFLMGFLVFAAVWAGYTLYTIYLGDQTCFIFDDELILKREKWGVLGDFFGGILNPIFAFLGLIMLLATLIQSQKELSLTRKEIKSSTKALQGQAETQKTQSFEGTFFQLLRLHQDIVNSMDLYTESSGKTVKGRDCFESFYHRLSYKFDLAIGKTPELVRLEIDKALDSPLSAENSATLLKIAENSKDIDVINSAYDYFFKENQANIGHYFRNMYNIVKFIDQSKQVDKQLYCNLLRAQISVNEAILLFYNCLSDFGNYKFKPLVERYSLLKGMPIELLLDEQNHLGFYEESAFETPEN